MPQTNQLHWSFNHDNRLQTPFFAEQVLDRLWNLPPRADVTTTYYDVFPNFWRGYKRSSEGEKDKFELKIGEIVVTTHHSDSREWHYDIHSMNTTSGEEMRLLFRCADEPARPLLDGWQITVQNSAGDRYRQFDCQGHITPKSNQTQITLTVNDIPLEVGTVDTAVPLTCNWSLFDALPLLSDHLKCAKTPLSMTLLEDLEKIRRQTQLGYLEDWTLVLDEATGQMLKLNGYFLYGHGLTPSYWWLDQDNRVVIVSSTFQTWVLTSNQ